MGAKENVTQEKCFDLIALCEGTVSAQFVFFSEFQLLGGKLRNKFALVQ